MSHYFYITPEEYEMAKNKGIHNKMLEQRIRDLGWTKEKALNTPVGNYTNRGYWSEIAKRNGIKYGTFMNRVYRGWDEEKAATRPTMTKEEIGLLVKNSIPKKG